MLSILNIPAQYILITRLQKKKKNPSKHPTGLFLLITDNIVFLSRLFIGTLLLFLDTFHFTSFLFVISNLFKNFGLRIFWST